MSRKLEAIKGSCEKWEGISTGEVEDRAADNCPLCQEFRFCKGCPAAFYAGRRGCYGTPYRIWNDLFYADEFRFADTPERKEAALLELFWLYFVYWAEYYYMDEKWI